MVPNLKQQVASSLSLLTSNPSNAPRHAGRAKRHDSSASNTSNTSSARNAVTRLWSSNDTTNDAAAFPPSISKTFAHQAVGAIGPTAVLVGGTAAMYKSLLNHPSSTLTPLSIFYMLLLAIQPRLSRKYIPKKVSKVKVALVEEVIKTSVASILFWKWSAQTVVKEALKDWTLSSSLLVAGVPATLYAVQGVLTYLSHQHLDSVTFNGLSQTKTLTAALCCYIVMGKRQSPLQIVALAMLFVSAFVFQNMAIGVRWNRLKNQSVAGNLNQPQRTNENSEPNNNLQTPQPTTAATAPTDSSTHLSDRSFLLYGVAPCLGATFLSGLAGAFSQRGLQIVGGSGRNAFLYTVEVSFFSALALLFSQAISTLKNNNKNSKSNVDKISTTTADAISGWPWQTYIPITCKAMGGILTALVHKHAGSVVKGFALMLGLVISGILQSLWFDTPQQDKDGGEIKQQSRLPMHQVMGIIIVMFSSWLHFTNPPS